MEQCLYPSKTEAFQGLIQEGAPCYYDYSTLYIKKQINKIILEIGNGNNVEELISPEIIEYLRDQVDVYNKVIDTMSSL